MTNLNKLTQIISQNLGIEKDLIKPESHFYQDFNVDKMSMADLMLEVSSQFAIKIPEDLSKINTVYDIIKLIDETSNEYL